MMALNIARALMLPKASLLSLKLNVSLAPSFQTLPPKSLIAFLQKTQHSSGIDIHLSNKAVSNNAVFQRVVQTQRKILLLLCVIFKIYQHGIF